MIPVFLSTGPLNTYLYLPVNIFSSPLTYTIFNSSPVIYLSSLVSDQLIQASCEQDTHEVFISRQRPSSGPFPVTQVLPWLSLGHKDIRLMNDRAGTSPASPFDPLVGLIACNARAMPHPTPAGPRAAAARPMGFRGQLFPYC